MINKKFGGIAFLSDPHLLITNPESRIDNAVEEVRRKFVDVLDFCKKENYALVIAGDFTEAPRSWHLYSWIASILKQKGVYVFSIYGQHDTYMYSVKNRNATILGGLIASGLVYELNDARPIVLTFDSRPLKNRKYNLWGTSYEGKIPSLAKGNNNILAIHAPISSVQIPGVKVNSAFRILKNNKRFRFIHCGDIHRRFFLTNKSGRRYIFNTGPLIRKEASVAMIDHKPCLFFVDFMFLGSGLFFEYKIPVKRPIEVLSREKIEEANQKKEILHSLIDSISSKEKFGVNIRRNLKNALIELTDIPTKAFVRRLVRKVDDRRSEDG